MEKETEKEFDDSFMTTHGGKHPPYDMLEIIKKFISTHFIDKRILQKELEKIMEYYREESQKYLDRDAVMLAYDFDSRYVALKDIKDKLL